MRNIIKQISNQFETSFIVEREMREKTEDRLHSTEQILHDSGLSLTTERQAHEETKIRLNIIKQISNQFETSFIVEREMREKTEERLHSTEQILHDSELSLTTESQAHAETKRRLSIIEQRSNKLESSWEVEREMREETEERLKGSEQILHEFGLSLDAERRKHEETQRRLHSTEQKSSELGTTLNATREAFEERRNSRVQVERDWVLTRNEVILSDKAIGRGASGIVVEGTFRGCKVAVKEIHQSIVSPHNRRMFEREMDMASRCRHPCLLQFIGATNDDQSPLFVTELLDTSLRAVLGERALLPTEINTIALDVAKGLNYLHLKHPVPIIHRDISSANVLLWKHGTRWRAKVSDYGTANFLQQSMTANPGAVIYAAPEAQTRRQSPKVDVYSFGVLLCEMNVREMPDVDRREQQVAMVTNTLFSNMIIRCLKLDPEERPSMAEITEHYETAHNR